jgi:FixJ family two-component response regulator
MNPIVHIVDDDKSFRTAIGRLVEASGFRAVHYESGDEFLANLPKAGQGCILLDLEMPGLSGPDLQRRLSQDAPLLPIIYLTGRGDIKGSVRAIKDGAEDFIEKPASGKAIGEAIERALLQYDKRR